MDVGFEASRPEADALFWFSRPGSSSTAATAPAIQAMTIGQRRRRTVAA
jgi:hypothetical protein